MKNTRWLVLAVLALLVGCAKPLPEDKRSYVGLWKSNEVSLLITASGRLEYENRGGSAKTSISAPIKELTDEKISAGILFLSTEFVINRPPREENGLWSLVVDGKELFKADESGQLRQAKVVPPLGALRTMVSADLRLLSKGIKSNDFSEYISHASQMFQSQFSNARMQELYKPFVDRSLDLEQLMVGDFALTSEPAISPQGVLTIHGRYPTNPVSLKFEALYTYVHPEWKSFGVEVKIGKD